MNNKSALKYLLGLIILIALIIVASSLGKSKTAEKKFGMADDINKTATNPTPAAPVVSPTSDASPASDNVLVGTWVSSVKGKGMQASGEVKISGATSKFNLSGDVEVSIQKVVGNTASGTITFNNLCSIKTVSVPGKDDVSEPPQCINGSSKPVELQINGNAISFQSQAETGANISFTGNYANDSVSGTFTRESSYGKMDGTFNLVRAKS
jgi:hypothetical protein